MIGALGERLWIERQTLQDKCHALKQTSWFFSSLNIFKFWKVSLLINLYAVNSLSLLYGTPLCEIMIINLPSLVNN